MLACYVVLDSGTTAKVRIILMAGCWQDLRVRRGEEKELSTRIFPLFWYLLVVYEFCRVGGDASRFRGVLTVFWGTGHVHLEGRKRLRAHHKKNGPEV